MLEKLYALIAEVPVVMMTTRRADGRLITRPLATQSPDGAGDLWFLASDDATLVEELACDANVSLSYVTGDEWVSVTGTARIVHEGWVRIEVTVLSAEAFDGVTTTALDDAPAYTGRMFGEARYFA